MSHTDRKHVQTELTEDEYESFRESAAERGMTVEEAGHEALVRWVEQQRQPDPTDRAFTVLDKLETESLRSTAATDARQESDIIAEWERCFLHACRKSLGPPSVIDGRPNTDIDRSDHC